MKSSPVDAAKTLIQAFISNCLDYCNAALCGITDTLLRKLQSVQNAAARLLTRTGRREHITPVLKQLHWLPISRRIDFKLAVLMYQISRGAPTYLQDRCRLASEVRSGRRLRSANEYEGCNSCASLAGLVLSFIACFVLLVVAPLRQDSSGTH